MTKEEIRAMIEVQSKNVEQLTIIANHLSNIADRETKIYERLYNGLAKDIASTVLKEVESTHASLSKIIYDHNKTCAEFPEKIAISVRTELEHASMTKDAKHVKWFVGVIGLILVFTNVIVTVVSRRNSDNDMVKSIVELLQAKDKSRLQNSEH